MSVLHQTEHGSRVLQTSQTWMRHSVIRFLRHSQKLVRTLIVKALGSQASKFEANHRYITDAIVGESVADTPSGVDSNETWYSYGLPNRSRRALCEEVRHASSRTLDCITAIREYFCSVHFGYLITFVTYSLWLVRVFSKKSMKNVNFRVCARLASRRGIRSRRFADIFCKNIRAFQRAVTRLLAWRSASARIRRNSWISRLILSKIMIRDDAIFRAFQGVRLFDFTRRCDDVRWRNDAKLRDVQVNTFNYMCAQFGTIRRRFTRLGRRL